MCYLKAQAQLEYALLVGAIIAAIIVVLYARSADFSRLSETISAAGDLNVEGEMVESD